MFGATWLKLVGLDPEYVPDVRLSKCFPCAAALQQQPARSHDLMRVCLLCPGKCTRHSLAWSRRCWAATWHFPSWRRWWACSPSTPPPVVLQSASLLACLTPRCTSATRCSVRCQACVLHQAVGAYAPGRLPLLARSVNPCHGRRRGAQDGHLLHRPNLPHAVLHDGGRYLR